MCVTCGCGNPEGAVLTLHDVEHRHEQSHERSHGHPHVHPHGHLHEHPHEHPHGHPHEHPHGHEHPYLHQHEYQPEREHSLADGTRHSHGHGHVHVEGMRLARADSPGFAAVPFRQRAHAHGHDQTIHLEAQILGKNQAIANRNRSWLADRGILALNLVSSPGAGKTTLLERTLLDLKSALAFSVIEGDQATSNDAARIRATGVPAVQINTGTGCHLEADMLERALDVLKPAPQSLLMIENVGNLVCPALFDLGERAKVVIFSVTEGEDKPLKYPHMFRAADVLLLSKMDLLPHVRFDVDRAAANALAVNPRLSIFRVSGYTGEGLAPWYDWLRQESAACRRTDG